MPHPSRLSEQGKGILPTPERCSSVSRKRCERPLRILDPHGEVTEGDQREADYSESASVSTGYAAPSATSSDPPLRSLDCG
jgi:hypothetical protein